MDFFLVGFILWTLIVASFLLFIWGFWKRSWKALFMSGTAFLIPSLYLGSAQGCLKLFVLLPAALFVFAHYTKNRG